MKTGTSALPKFDPLRHQPEATPVARAGRGVAGFFRHRVVVLFERFAVGDRRALLRRDRGKPAFERPAVEIFVALFRRSALYYSFDPDLTL
jgi:hypothetical protein